MVLLEREAGLARHSSGKSARILRSSGGHPTTRALTRASAEFLRQPPEGFGPGPLVDARGLVLLCGPAGRAALEAEVDEDVEAGRAREVSPRELEDLLPHLRSAHGERTAAWLFPEDGRIDTDRLLAGLARGAREGGVDIRTSCRVDRLLARDGRVRGVRLADGEAIEAQTVVLAAGAWAGSLGAAVGSRVHLRPTRRHLMVTMGAVEAPEGPALWDVELGFYARREGSGMLLCACDQSDVDPDRLSEDPAVYGRIRRLAARLLGTSLAPGAEAWAGLRTLSADGAFVVGPDPDLEGLYWVAGLGGAGMGAGPEAGRLAAEHLLGGPPPPGGLAPDRAASILR